MKNSKMYKAGAIVITLLFFCMTLATPSFSATSNNKMSEYIERTEFQQLFEDKNEGIPQMYDTIYIPIEDVSMAGDQNDIGYNVDSGGRITKSLPVYVGEPVDQTIPGNGRTGTLDPDDNDDADWYLFSVSEGQTLTASVSSSEDYDFEFSNSVGEPVGHSYTADATGLYFINIFANDGAGAADYTFDVMLGGQNTF